MTGNKPGSNSPVLLYDGHCVLCSRSVQFILRYEKSNALKFCAMQSPAGKEILKANGINDTMPGSLVLVENGETLTSYQAVARTASYLKFPWSLAALTRLLPSFIGNPSYRWVARNRTKFFGSRSECMLRTKGYEDRFLV